MSSIVLFMKKKSDLFRPVAYNHRDVMTLLPLPTWSKSEEQIQIKNNRILQPGFMQRDSQKVLNDAKKTGVQWLTDVCCPTTKASVYLQICKEMVVNYQVSEIDLNTKAHEVYASIIKNPAIIDRIEAETNERMDEFLEQKNLIEDLARKMLSQNLGLDNSAISKDQLESAQNLVIDLQRKKIVNSLTNQAVKNYLQENAQNLELSLKTRHEIGTNNDFVFLGAAGSGKSTIAQQYTVDDKSKTNDPNKINKNDSIILAPDNYRAFTLPGTDAFEAMQTQDIFTRTQDVAYMVKELVQQEIQEGMMLDNKRPNIICDCLSLDKSMRTLVAQSDPDKGGSLTSIVVAYRGDPGFVGIAERADYRARDKFAAPADKGRFVETASLFISHVNSSKYLLSSVPENAITQVFDSNVDRSIGELPVKIATIDSKMHVVEITNLRVMSEFLNKKNMNVEAEHPVELILPKNSAKLVTAPENKANALLDLVRGKPSYTLSLQDPHGTEYARLIAADNGDVKFQVSDLDLLKKLANRESSPEAQVLRATIAQISKQNNYADNSLESQAINFCTQIDEKMSILEKNFKKNDYKEFNQFKRELQSMKSEAPKEIDLPSEKTKPRGPNFGG